MLPENAQIQAQRPDVGGAGGLPRHFDDRAARPVGGDCDFSSLHTQGGEKSSLGAKKGGGYWFLTYVNLCLRFFFLAVPFIEVVAYEYDNAHDEKREAGQQHGVK
jgi:hypothetical protein